MPIPLSPELENEYGKRFLSPSYYVVAPGIPLIFGNGAVSAQYPLTYGAGKLYGAQPPGGSDAGKIYKYADSILLSGVGVRRLNTPTGFESTATPEQGDSSYGGVELDIQDCPELRSLISGYRPLKGKEFQVWAGAAGVPTSKWAQVFTGQFDDATQWDDALGWNISLVDIQRTQRTRIFTGLQTELSVGLYIGGTTAYVLDATAFPTSSGADATWKIVLRIDDEYLLFSARTATNFTVTRGFFGSTEAFHASGAKVTECMLLAGNPIDSALRVLLSTGTGGNTLGGVSYDVLPERWALGVPIKWVDVRSRPETSYEAVRDKILAGGNDNFQFMLEEPSDARQWFATEIYKACNILPIVYGDGKMGVRLFEPPEPSASLYVFDGSVTLARSARAKENQGRQYNSFEIAYDWSGKERKFKTTWTYDDAESVAAYKAASKGTGRYVLPMQSKGARESLGGRSSMLSKAQRAATRFAWGPQEIQAAGLFPTMKLEQGDLVLFSNPYLLDSRSTNRGVGPLTVQIIGKSMDFAAGVMRFKLQYAFNNFKYARFASMTQTDYSNVLTTQAQRDRYGFIADPLLPDATDPYRYE